MPVSRNLSLKSRYAVILILLGLIALMEARHPFPFFRLATFFLAFLELASVASLLRGKLRDGFVILASLAFGLCVVEAVARILEFNKGTIFLEGLFGPRRPVVGWGPGQAGRFPMVLTNLASGATIYSTHYTIDADLLRQTHSGASEPTIVFFGDSFTFGVGVNDADTLPQQFADLLDRKQRVLNLAYSAYGPQQFLRELETGLFDHVIGSRPGLFVFLTAAWHAERTACKRYWVRWGPRYALENGEVALKGACYEGLSLRVREWLENAASYRMFIEPYLQKVTHENVELYIRILLAAVNFAKQKYGVATLIPYITTRGYLEGKGFSDDEIIRRLRDGGAMVVDVSLAKEEAGGAIISIKGDGHPTPLANRLRASIIKNYIENHMPGILVTGPPGSNSDG
ncbi:MAG: SGNH/GDSL hydrolase family protein [Methylocella sp.]